MEIIAFDSHKRYTISRVEDLKGKLITEKRIEHGKGEIRKFLEQFTPGSSVAVETIGNWYWIVDEIEEAGMKPLLVHARKAKLMMGSVNKTDRLDAKGLNMLKRCGTLPEVWIPPGDVRDKRDLGRTRMVFANTRTRLKNRIHSVLAKYAVHDFDGISDIFGKKGMRILKCRMEKLPPQTRFATECLIGQLDKVCETIAAIERRIRDVFEETEEVKLLMSMPGVGFLLATVIWNETGNIKRFSSPGQFASYSGTTPRVHSSGGKTRYGPLRSDVNHYLKWAFSEAGNSICVNRRVMSGRHAARLYSRIRNRKGHPKAIGAVARHLAEAAFWILTRMEPYKEPKKPATSSRKA